MPHFFINSSEIKENTVVYGQASLDEKNDGKLVLEKSIKIYLYIDNNYDPKIYLSFD